MLEQTLAEKWLATHGYKGSTRNNRGEYVFDRLVRSLLIRDEPDVGIVHLTDEDYNVHETEGYMFGDGSVIASWDGAYIVFNEDGRCVFQGLGKRVNQMEDFVE